MRTFYLYFRKMELNAKNPPVNNLLCQASLIQLYFLRNKNCGSMLHVLEKITERWKPEKEKYKGGQNL